MTSRIGQKSSSEIRNDDAKDMLLGYLKRTYISKVENDGENITLRTLYDIVERGLGGRLRISFEF